MSLGVMEQVQKKGAIQKGTGEMAEVVTPTLKRRNSRIAEVAERNPNCDTATPPSARLIRAKKAFTV